jgi:hypothetical protein
MSLPRRSKHNYPNQPCPQGYYHWNNGFSSGCKPRVEDQRHLALQFRSVRDTPSPQAVPTNVADGVAVD